MEVNQEWIDQQRALCDAATPGPWNHSDWGSVLAFTDCEVCQNAVDADMTFISAARTALPAALDALEAAYAEIARLTAERDAAERRADMAVRDLKLSSCCVSCKKYPCHHNDDDDIYGCTDYVWRGLCAANTDAPTVGEDGKEEQ